MWQRAVSPPIHQLEEVQKTNEAAWANIPSDAFFQITSKLPSLEEFSRLGTVCKSWNFAVNNFSEKPSLSLKTPVLMLVEEREKEETEGKGIKVKARPEITDLDSKLMINVWRLELSPPQKRCFGVKYGWLLTVSMDLQINLVHPISEYQINLPPCPTSDYLRDPQYHYVINNEDTDADSGVAVAVAVADLPTIRKTFLWKAALSSNPLSNITNCTVSDECVVMGIFSDLGMLAFAKLKDRVWTVVKSVSYNFVDVIYFNGQFYSINDDGALFVCVIDDEGDPMAYKIASVKTEIWFEKYLVEVLGDLLLILREFGSRVKRTVPVVSRLYPRNGSISMHMLVSEEKYGSSSDSSDKESECWFERECSLGNMAVMVGASSVSLDAPGIKGCFKQNRVFVTDDKTTKPPYGMDVFDFRDSTCEGFNFSRLFQSLSPSCPPFWYV